MSHRRPRVAAACWVLLCAAQSQAQAQPVPAGPAGSAAQDGSTMERAQREADGPRRRILEAAKAREKAAAVAAASAAAAAKAVDATPPRPKPVPAAPAAAAAPEVAARPLALNAEALSRPEALKAAAARPTGDKAEVPAFEALRAVAPPAPQPQLQQLIAPPAGAFPVTAVSPPIAAPAAPAVAEPSAGEIAYAAELNRLVDGLKRYPTSREARSLRPQGTVRLWLEIDRQGQLLQAGLESSSGATLLDSEALRSVRQGRYPAFPAGAFEGTASRRFLVGIEYRAEGS